MRWTALFFFLCAGAGRLAAQDVPVGVVTGRISDVHGRSFLVTTAAGREFRCSYDQRTWFESSKMRVSVDAFRPEDTVEIVADKRLTESAPCYARTVRLADAGPKETQRMRITYRAVTEHIVPRGEYSWAGAVSSNSESELVLRTRTEGYKTLLIRKDTRFLEDGVLSARDRLQPNTKVFVRAGRNLEGLVEVYQVVWGAVTPGDK